MGYQSNMIRRGMVVGSSLCPLCLDGEETTKHLFITCNVVQRVWMNVIGGLESS